MQEPKTSTEVREPRGLLAAVARCRYDLDRERVAVWVLVLSGMMMRFWYLYDFAGSPLFDLAIGADVREYYQRSQQLLLGVHFPVSPDIHAPLYSYFLALMLKLGGGSIPFVRVAQVILNYAAWLAFYWLLKTERTPLKVRLWFLGIVMLLPVPVCIRKSMMHILMLWKISMICVQMKNIVES